MKLNHEKVNKLHRLVLFILTSVVSNKSIVCIFAIQKCRGLLKNSSLIKALV